MESTLPLVPAPPSRRGPAVSTRMQQHRSRPVAVAVNLVSVAVSECIAITSAMQKRAKSHYSSVSAILGGSPGPMEFGLPRPLLRSPEPSIGEDGSSDLGAATRWGLRGKRGKSMQDNPLISGFGRLRHQLTGVKDIHEFDSLLLLHPFLQVIQAKGTAAPITVLALDAIRKFLAYGLIAPESPRFALAMQSLSVAITHCHFDTSDSSQDEVVLMTILQLMESMLSSPGGDTLSDESICEMMGRGLGICSWSGFSEVLRHMAMASMMHMCQIIFEHLEHLETETTEETGEVDRQTRGDMENARIELVASYADIPPRAPELSNLTLEDRPLSPTAKVAGEETGDDGESRTESSGSDNPRPYSLPTARELLRVLVSFLDPHDRGYPDQMKVMALHLIRVALEVAGPSIVEYPAIATIAENQLCCYLFQLVRSNNMEILQEALMVTSTLLSTCRGALKLQQELYLSYLVACLHFAVDIPREPGMDPALYSRIPLAPRHMRNHQKPGLEDRACKPDARQAMVENIDILTRTPTFMVELFVNYDCDEHRSDLCEDLIGMLSRNALPDSATWSTTSVPPLCLDILLRYIRTLFERLDDEPLTLGYASAEMLQQKRRRKKLVVEGVKKFNQNPKKGLAYLQEKGIIEDATDPESVASFLRGTSRVDKKVLGEFISKRENEALLDAFMAKMDFAGKRVHEALRDFLGTFRLPGEAPLINRIVTAFAERYVASSVLEDVADKDAVYVLTYAIILLNTDQHNPTVKTRMEYKDFTKNLRGVNKGGDFAPEFLQDIFDSIRSNEIILPDEHDNEHAFDFMWKELIQKTDSAGPLTLYETNIYDADMFDETWGPIISCLTFVFMSATDDPVYTRVVAGFDECAQIAAKYGNSRALDEIISQLSSISTLSTSLPADISLNTEVKMGESSVMVSQLAIDLGRDLRAQLATLVLFRVVTGSEHAIQDGWKHIIRIWLKLFVNSLIPPYFSTNDWISLPPIPLQSPPFVINSGVEQTESGFLAAFAAYMSGYAANNPPAPSDEEVERTLCTVDCVNACQIGDIFENINNLSASRLEPLVEALLGEIPDDESRSGAALANIEANPTPPPGSSKPASSGLHYDASLTYILEFCVALALRDQDTIHLLGPRIAEALQGILRDAVHHHPIIVGRSTFYLLRLLQASNDVEFVHIPALLHSISNFATNTLSNVTIDVLQSLKLCIETPGPLRNEIMRLQDFWAIVKSSMGNPEAASVVLEILERGVSEWPPAITVDAYKHAVDRLSDFATAARVGVEAEQQRQQSSNHGRQPQNKGAEPVAGENLGDNAAVARGMKAVNVMYSMAYRIPQLASLSHLQSDDEAWSAYWLPTHEALAKQCANPCREVRHLAISSLQRLLLSPNLAFSDQENWTAIFGSILFPWVKTLLRPEVYSSDRDGMNETRVQAASLICKVFLQYLVLSPKWDGMLDLWVGIIDIMDRLVNSGQGEGIEEAVSENLKNVLLFMHSSGHLVTPGEDLEKEKTWTETWKRIDRFLPEIKAQLVLSMSQKGSKTFQETTEEDKS